MTLREAWRLAWRWVRSGERGEALALTVKVPPTVDRATAARAVSDLVVALDGLHRAEGGSGLRLERDAIPWRLRGAAIRALATRCALDETERAALGRPRSWT